MLVKSDLKQKSNVRKEKWFEKYYKQFEAGDIVFPALAYVQIQEINCMRASLVGTNLRTCFFYAYIVQVLSGGLILKQTLLINQIFYWR